MRMHIRTLGAIALGVVPTYAFRDTSPFFLYSTTELLISSPDLVSAKQLTEVIKPHLELCNSDTYVIVSQPGVNGADYHHQSAAPYLRNSVLGADNTIRSSLEVKDVLGQIDSGELSRMVQNKCGAEHLRVDASTGSFAIADDMKPRVINLDFPALPDALERSQTLAENDAILASVINLLSPEKYTVIYTTSPSTTAYHRAVVEALSYEMDSAFQAPVQMELKRDLSHHERALDSNVTLPDGPLFERYQYLTPGLFMGLLVSLILVSILYVGITSVASLQVSYAAFDKEMGPTGQKKQA